MYAAVFRLKTLSYDASDDDEDNETEDRDADKERCEDVVFSDVPEDSRERLEQVERRDELVEQELQDRSETHAHPVRAEALALRVHLQTAQSSGQRVQRGTRDLTAENDSRFSTTVLYKYTAH